MTSYKVLAVRDLGEVEREFALKRAQRAALTRLERHACEGTPAAATRKAPADEPAADEPAADEPAADGAVDAVAALAAWDADIEEEAAGDEDGAAEEDPVAELVAHVPADDVEEMEEAIEAGDGGAGSDMVSDRASDDEEDDGERLPIYDDKGQVRNPDDASDIWGRIAVIREGQPSECVSVYCRRHGCSVLTRTKDALLVPQYLRWFQLGQDLPKDRSASAQHRHKKMLADV